MSIKLFYVPDMNLLFNTINCCDGYVYLELKDQSYLNLKNGGEGEFFLKNVGECTKGLTIVTEKKTDAGRIMTALM